jgi:hypothetical protein
VLYEYSRYRTKGSGTKNENGKLYKEGMKSASCRVEPLFFHHFVVKPRYFFRFPIAKHQTHQRSVFIKRRFSETVRKFPADPGEWFGNPPDFSGVPRPSYLAGTGQTEFHGF